MLYYVNKYFLFYILVCNIFVVYKLQITYSKYLYIKYNNLIYIN